MGNMILNSKERKQLFGRLETQWGIAVPDAMREQAWLKSGERYYLAGRSLEQLPGLRLERLGIYTLSEHDGALRLSVEGSQLLPSLAAVVFIQSFFPNNPSWPNPNKIPKLL